MKKELTKEGLDNVLIKEDEQEEERGITFAEHLEDIKRD